MVRPVRPREFGLGLHSMADAQNGVPSCGVLRRSAVMQALHRVIMQICNLLRSGTTGFEFCCRPAISETVLEGDALADNYR